MDFDCGKVPESLRAAKTVHVFKVGLKYKYKYFFNLAVGYSMSGGIPW